MKISNVGFQDMADGWDYLRMLLHKFGAALSVQRATAFQVAAC